MVTVKKTQFAGLNDQRSDFYDPILSFPYDHPLLDEFRKGKRDLKRAFIKSSTKRKKDLLKTETSAVQQHERLRVLRSILAQLLIHYK